MRITKAALFAGLPPEWPENLLPVIRARLAASRNKLVVLDDDPTGTQTVHDVPILTEWTVDRLTAELASTASCFYVLTNSRSLPLPDAQVLNADIGRNLTAAARQTRQLYTVVSRSDSTLRGHYPGEVDALASALDRPFDAQLLIPFFLEGGRYTIDDIHYVTEGDMVVPAAETPYAHDASFGYRSSNLRDWVAEKTGGRIHRDDVAAVSLDDIRCGGPQRVTQQLLSLPHGATCVINAASYRDLETVVLGLLEAEAQGKRYLYRSAASFVRVRAGIAPRPLLTQADINLSVRGGGLFVVGSYVPKTTTQVAALLDQPDVVPVEINVRHLLDRSRTGPHTVARATEMADAALRAGRDVVIYTSRELITGNNALSSLIIGQRISGGLAAMVRAIETQPGYLVAKGGITSSDVATKGLNVRRAVVLGQILPGVPVWRLGAETRYPDSAYIVFPGNVGDSDSLVAIRDLLRAER